jgi:hypothetical protein
MAHLLVLVNFLINLLLVTIIENCKHEVEEHVKTHQEEEDEVEHSEVILLPEREDDVWEVTGGEEHVNIENTGGNIFEVAEFIVILFVCK